MTPRQRRQHFAGMGIVATAPRKSYLGKFTPLTSIQAAWIKSLLTVWGEGVRGSTGPKMPRRHSCWNGLRGSRWSDKALERFTAALNQARSEGFKGQHIMNRAHAILWPKETVSVIEQALRNDDIDFVEQSVLLAMDANDPVYLVGLQYYTTRKKSQTLPGNCRLLHRGLLLTRPENVSAGVWKYSGQRCFCLPENFW